MRTAQDLSIFSGLPPLVRSGDQFGASFTLRNATNKPMTVTARVRVTPEVATGAPLTVTIPAGGTTPVTWHLTAPDGVDSLNWSIDASAGKARDTLSVTQDVIPAVPVEVWAATLMRVTETSSLPLQAPAGALAGMGVAWVAALGMGTLGVSLCWCFFYKLGFGIRSGIKDRSQVL